MAKSKLKDQRSHVFSYMWKIDLQIKCIYRNIYDHTYTHVYMYNVTERTKLLFCSVYYFVSVYYY
jgi:hypothetical protein